MKKYLFKPATDFMDKRAEGIKENLEKAEKQREETEKLKEDYKKELEEIKAKSNDILKDAARKGEARKAEIVKEAKQEAEEIIDRARIEIDREKEKAISEMKDQVVTLSVMAASKIIDNSLDEKAHKKLVEDFIEEVGEVEWQT